MAAVLAHGLAVWLMLTNAASAQNDPAKSANKAAEPAKDRRRALSLSAEHRDLEALPMLEALAKADPKDREVLERLAVALVSQSVTVKPEDAPAILRRARTILVDLKKRGPLSDLGEILLDGLPPNPHLPKLSDKLEVEAAMRKGEAAFARRDFAEAREAYRKALQLDPKLCVAALFVGDSYFAENRFVDAGTWYSRAILIDPNRESAHRYYGDALLKSGLIAEAREQYIEAVVAEPYTRGPWVALTAWARVNQVPIGHPRIEPEALDDPHAKNGARGVAPNDGRPSWKRYAEIRASWAKGKFKENFPNEPSYRHSLAEETDALLHVALAIVNDIKEGSVKDPNPCFMNLLKLVKDGLLEAHILYARADEGIAQDYAAYRDKHRGELRRYLSDVVVPPKEAEAKPGEGRP
jgi:tetratricopeptide (TPR) repeat protein